MKDNPYVVILDADEFGELYWAIERELEDLSLDEPPEPAHRQLVTRVMHRLRLAGRIHVCLDEQEETD